MKACGLVVEYNPLHNGHIYHINQAKKTSGADCMIAVMSGSFLQRGEPAIIDKFHRTRMALEAGIDIVLELPFAYAVQSSDLFAKGAIQTLNEIGASSICFGSESGDINNFIESFHLLNDRQATYQSTLKKYSEQGMSYPQAIAKAYQRIGLTTDLIDLSKPNNVLGFNYVQEILNNNLPIKPITIKRIKNNYHDENIQSSITSATSLRQDLLKHPYFSSGFLNGLPETSLQQFKAYDLKAGLWHTWEDYFPLLHYKITTMSISELSKIHGVVEGLEYRIKDKIKHAYTFNDLITGVKTKRYTWTRLQRIFVHILTNTKKDELSNIQQNNTVPYIRALGLSQIGRDFLKQKREELTVPVYTQLSRKQHHLLSIEERASDAYYSALPIKSLKKLRTQELEPPLFT